MTSKNAYKNYASALVCLTHHLLNDLRKKYKVNFLKQNLSKQRVTNMLNKDLT